MADDTDVPGEPPDDVRPGNVSNETQPDDLRARLALVLGASSKPSASAPGEPGTTIEPDTGVRPGDNPALSQEPERRNNKKTDDEIALAFLAEVESGVKVRAAAINCGLNLRTAYHVLARSDADVDALRDATRKLLAVEALDRIDDWRTASVVGASKKGNHAPARDWLLHAGVIDALDTDSAQVRIAINIGTDEQPMRILSPLKRTE